VSKPSPPRSRRPHDSAETFRPLRRAPEPPPTDDDHSEKVARIAGLPAVQALFQRAPERVVRLFYEDRMVPQVGEFCSRLARLHRPYRLVDGEELARIAGTVLHGGIVAVAEPRPILPFDPKEVGRWAEAGQPLFVLDGIGNPHNLGAIARTLAFFGFEHLILSDHPAQAGVSDAAYRVAEGGLEHLNLYRAAPLSAALRRIGQDYRVVGTALGRGVPLETLREDPRQRPVCLILGNEEEGLPRETLKACEAVISIRGAGRVQSLNVSATTAILAYAARPRPKFQPTERRAPSGRPSSERRPFAEARPAAERRAPERPARPRGGDGKPRRPR
jgi:TrmH RNA methyltransferase